MLHQQRVLIQKHVLCGQMLYFIFSEIEEVASNISPKFCLDYTENIYNEID